jgi:sodium transport system ATP-binding protein
MPGYHPGMETPVLQVPAALRAGCHQITSHGCFMIQLENLSKTYRQSRHKQIRAVQSISFECRPGEVFGLLGPNGAGKTTTLRMISTALKPTSGRILVQNHDVVHEPDKVRRQVGFMSASTGLYGRLTPAEVLRYFGRLYGMDPGILDRRLAILNARLDLDSFLHRPCDKLSSGMKQRVSIARTLIHDPPVIVFDEATSGLDVITGRNIIRFIRDCRDEGKTVLFSTHIMAEVARLCDRVAVIHEGSLAFCGTLDELKTRHGDDLEEAFMRMVGVPDS